MGKFSSSQVFRLLAEELQRSFSPQALTELAKQTQFVQRTSKFRVQDLSSLCIGMGQEVVSHLLTRLCGSLEEEAGILISPEGLNLQLNTKAFEFFHTLFSKLLKKQLLSTTTLISSFSQYF
ncbi:TPA: hypothetical protein ROY01_005945 [Bacillus toyonensis]|nr:hypothetical protein [Bacillus toyonensis]